MESTFVNPVGFFSFNFDLKYYRAYKILKEPCFFFNEGDYEQGAKEMSLCWVTVAFFKRKAVLRRQALKGKREKCSSMKLFQQFTLILVILSSICRWQ